MKIEKIGKVGNMENFGNPDKDEDQNEPQDESNFNRLMPREFLKKVPGINSNNI